ncbi:MAG: AI-2E family transporter [bacterium]|nr:AI-2E family transporter [bacterium]
MKREHLLIALFFVIAAVFFYLFYLIVVPFFIPIAWAAVFAIVFYPLYEKLAARLKRPRLASTIMCLLIVVLIVGPIAYLFVALVNEAASAVSKVNELYKSGQLNELYTIQLPWVDAIKEKLSQYYDMSQMNFDAIIRESVDKVSGVILGQTSWLIANGTKAVFYFFLMIFSMYYFFKDGDSIIDTLKRLMPLTDKQIDVTFGHLRDVTEATMYGGVVVALIQGLLGGVLFAIVGIPSAIFWGAIMAFLAIIPLVGAFIIYLPAGIILILGGSYISGIIVIAVGTLIISQVDNVIRPMLISGKTSLHPLLLFFAIMGGIYLWGLLGIIVGPIIAAVFITLIKILDLRLHPQTEED